MEIRHEREKGRFVADVEGGEAFVTYEESGDGSLNFTHTEVPRESRGRDVADRIVRSAMDYAREHDLEVVATCPYVAKWLEKNREYEELRAG